MKDRIYAWMITLFFALCVSGCAYLLIAQSKADTSKAKPPASITLNMDKLGERFQQFQKDLAECDKQIEAWTGKRNQIIGKMQGYNEAANDSTLRITEPPKKK